MRTRDPTTIKRVDVIGILLQLLLFQALGAPHQLFDPILDLLICRPRGPSNKAVIGIIAGIHRPGVIQVVHQDSREQVIDGKRVVRMLLDNALKLLRGAIVIHVVEVLESYIGEGIARNSMLALGRRIRVAANSRTGTQQKPEEKNADGKSTIAYRFHGNS